MEVVKKSQDIPALIPDKVDEVPTRSGIFPAYNPEQDTSYCTFRTIWGHVTDITFVGSMKIMVPMINADYLDNKNIEVIYLESKEVKGALKVYCEKHDVIIKADPNDANRFYYPFEQIASFVYEFMNTLVKATVTKHVVAKLKLK